MSEDHSPEPWIVGMKAAEGANVLVMSGGIIVADCAPDWCEDGTEVPNARRIVACVNACRGVPTESLERFSGEPDMPSLSFLIGWVGFHLDTIKRQYSEQKATP